MVRGVRRATEAAERHDLRAVVAAGMSSSAVIVVRLTVDARGAQAPALWALLLFSAGRFSLLVVRVRTPGTNYESA